MGCGFGMTGPGRSEPTPEGAGYSGVGTPGRLRRPIGRESSRKNRIGESILRKEVIQPQVPLRLPCYDLVPITELILGACFLSVSSATLDAPRFRGLTGGVYKAQEHIHRSIADLRLLAIPASCRRVAACNPNWAAFFGICLLSRVCFPLCAPL